MAILRETVNVWERRAPLAPQHVKTLVENGVKVIVQPSDRRAYSMQDYLRMGAEVKEDISEASLILGVKQVSAECLLPDKTYAFFTQINKRQTEISHSLDAVLEKNIRLIDYSRMVRTDGSRVLGFGKHAGEAGMINTLHVLGKRLLALGRYTPFVHIGPAHNYCSLDSAIEAVREAGDEISKGCLPYSIGPLIFVFTGTGQESQGAQRVFRELHHEFRSPENLPRVTAGNKVYACVMDTADLYKRKNRGTFDNEELRFQPERYASVFSQKVAPYASCIISGLPWTPNTPPLISFSGLREVLKARLMLQSEYPRLPHRLLAICDICDDLGGSVEFVKECSGCASPFNLYDARSSMYNNSFDGNGVMVCSVYNMPIYPARKATACFGNHLSPYITDMLRSEATAPFEECGAHPIVKNAVIASNGKQTTSW